MRRLWILIWNLSQVLEPSPQGVLRVVMRRVWKEEKSLDLQQSTDINTKLKHLYTVKHVLMGKRMIGADRTYQPFHNVKKMAKYFKIRLNL